MHGSVKNTFLLKATLSLSARQFQFKWIQHDQVVYKGIISVLDKMTCFTYEHEHTCKRVQNLNKHASRYMNGRKNEDTLETML